jgi:hypothetical protein
MENALWTDRPVVREKHAHQYHVYHKSNHIKPQPQVQAATIMLSLIKKTLQHKFHTARAPRVCSRGLQTAPAGPRTHPQNIVAAAMLAAMSVRTLFT